MIKKYIETDYLPLIDIWDSSVSATHDFLSSEDFHKIKEQLPFYFENVTLYTYSDHTDQIKAFLGVSDDMIEMLFVHDSERGKGIGKSLLMFAINDLRLKKVDVNEQNIQALYFYEKFGFKRVGYSKLDSEGMPYPIVHLELINDL